MGEAFITARGGGAALNFKLLAYATEEALLAATPAENTIGIITDTPINGYYFGVAEPSPAAAGMVWITVGADSQVAFSATKKNPIMVYPLSAKQYVDGAWADVTAMSYQGSEWVALFTGTYLYNKGDECTDLTGGWVGKNGGSYYSKGTLTKNEASIYIGATGGTKLIHAATTNLIDLTDVSALYVNVIDFSGDESSLAVNNSSTSWSTGGVAAKVNITGVGLFMLDVSALTGKYYVSVYTTSEDSSDPAEATFDEVYML